MVGEKFSRRQAKEVRNKRRRGMRLHVGCGCDLYMANR
jgi:hypothetical protein